VEKIGIILSRVTFKVKIRDFWCEPNVEPRNCVRRRPPHNALRSREQLYIGMWPSAFSNCMYMNIRTRNFPHVYFSAGWSMGPVCDRCLQCFSSFSLSYTLRDWEVVPAGARFLRNRLTIFRYAERVEPPSGRFLTAT
jgi:hypothetical protein